MENKQVRNVTGGGKERRLEMSSEEKRRGKDMEGDDCPTFITDKMRGQQAGELVRMRR